MTKSEEDVISRSLWINRRDALGLIGAGTLLCAKGVGGQVADREQQRAGHSGTKSRYASIAADPTVISVDLAQTAVIVVDMQNDFVSKGGMLDRLGADITPLQQAVGPTAAVLRSARNIGLRVIYLKMAFRGDLSDLGPLDSPNEVAHRHAGVGTRMRTPRGTEGRILIRETWNTEVVEQLKPAPSDLQIYKHRYSGFFETELDANLRRYGIRYLIVTGCTTSVCVESTIRDAMFRDYSAILLCDCTGEPLGEDLPRSNHQASLFLIAGRNFGWVSDSGAFLNSIRHFASS